MRITKRQIRRIIKESLLTEGYEAAVSTALEDYAGLSWPDFDWSYGVLYFRDPKVYEIAQKYFTGPGPWGTVLEPPMMELR